MFLGVIMVLGNDLMFGICFKTNWCALLEETHFGLKDTHRWKVKVVKRYTMQTLTKRQLG